MRIALRLTMLIAGLGLLLTACGSSADPEPPEAEPSSTGTVRSERAERQSSIMEQEQTRAQASAGETAQVDVSSEDEDAPALGVSEVGEIDFGHRLGLPYVRNVVGDPDAPVLIVEYSDFQ